MKQSVDLWVPGEVWTINKERKLHHHARAALVLPIRHAAMIIARNAINQGEVSRFTTPVIVTFKPVQAKAGTIADTANHLPPCKAVLDGCVDAGLIMDDTPEWVLAQTFLPPTKDKMTGVHITLDSAYTAR